MIYALRRESLGFHADQAARCAQNKTHALNNEIVVNALAGVVGVGITYIKDDEDIIPLLKVWHLQHLHGNAALLTLSVLQVAMHKVAVIDLSYMHEVKLCAGGAAASAAEDDGREDHDGQ